MERRRKLTVDERFVWGDCPVCDAKDGEPCNGHVGIPLGRNINGDVPASGAHLGRLQNAPFEVAEVPVR